ncbi:MAG: flagellar basal body L-ring protein FlgH [Rhodospirillaceae bacterium]
MAQLRRFAAVAAAAIAVSGCNMVERLASVGSQPKLTNVQNPVSNPHYRPVSFPMPTQMPDARHANSLWRTGARQFFKDQRAANVGDILTVTIAISDNAEISNSTVRTRNANESAAAPNFLGYETALNRILPTDINPSALIDLSSSNRSEGNGEISRDETVNLKLAAVVTQRLPNGNLVLHGRQEIQVNFEVRELQIAGVVRPEDIASDNTISYEKIAEARIAYGGRGHITDVQQARYGQQVFDIIWPF